MIANQLGLCELALLPVHVHSLLHISLFIFPSFHYFACLLLDCIQPLNFKGLFVLFVRHKQSVGSANSRNSGPSVPNNKGMLKVKKKEKEKKE